MDVLYVYCFKSVGSYKHKLSRIESLAILCWGINCSGTLLITPSSEFQDNTNFNIQYKFIHLITIFNLRPLKGKVYKNDKI